MEGTPRYGAQYGTAAAAVAACCSSCAASRGERMVADCADPGGQVAFFNEGSEVSRVD